MINKILKKTEVVDKKIPNTSGLAQKTDLNTKVTKAENKILIISVLVTTAALNTEVTYIE